MKERPILFSAPMVRALLDGTKTQTRRVVKPSGADHLFQFRGTTAAAGADEPTGEWAWCGSPRVVNKHIHCPYGKPGDRLWVREGHAIDGCRLFYRAGHGEADGAGPRVDIRWRPSIHMPRWASRITLAVTDVRVERLQDISEADAITEGCITEEMVSDYDGRTIRVPVEIPHASGIGMQGWDDAREWYADLWESINGDGSWDANPWVWAITFRRC